MTIYPREYGKDLQHTMGIRLSPELRIEAEEAAHIMQLGLSKLIEKDCINGPAEPIINRIRNQYIFEITIRLKRNKEFINQFKHIFQQQAIIIQNNKLYRSVQIIADVDPY